MAKLLLLIIIFATIGALQAQLTEDLNTGGTDGQSNGQANGTPDYTSSATAELRRNSSLSAPNECARECRENEPSKICYYHFTLKACRVCTPNANNVVPSNIQCISVDGVEGGILTANGMFPGPSIQVCENDKVVIDVENQMGGMEVTLDWRGIWKKGTQYCDGVPSVTECPPIQQGKTVRYQWQGTAGTHYWQAHSDLPKLDELYGGMVVRRIPKEDEPTGRLYDYDLPEHVMLIGDWIRFTQDDAMLCYRFPSRGQDAENFLLNGYGQTEIPEIGFMTNTPLFTIASGRRYRFRMINVSVCPAQVTFQGHNLTVIATNGKSVQPVQDNTPILSSGERYDVVIEANNIPSAYWVQVRGLGDCGTKKAQRLGILRYAGGPYQPSSQPPTYDVGLPQGVINLQ